MLGKTLPPDLRMLKSDRGAQHLSGCPTVFPDANIQSSGLKDGHCVGWILDTPSSALAMPLTCWMTLEESRALLAFVSAPCSGNSCQAQSWGIWVHMPGGLPSFANHHLTAPTKTRFSPWAMCQGGHFLQTQMTGGFSAGLNWGRLSEGQRGPLKPRLEIEKNPHH